MNVKQQDNAGRWRVRTYRCTSCGHEQPVWELVTDHGIYAGSDSNWCGRCDVGKPETVQDDRIEVG